MWALSQRFLGCNFQLCIKDHQRSSKIIKDHQRSSKIIKHHLLFHQLMAFPAQAAYGEYQAESAPWSNLYACGDCRRGASLVVTAIAEGRDCASRVDAMLMGTTTLPRAAPLAASPTFYQMPQKVSNTQA
jgi:hypothetical protein